MNLAIRSCRISAMQRKYMFEGLLLLSFTLASNGAMRISTVDRRAHSAKALQRPKNQTRTRISFSSRCSVTRRFRSLMRRTVACRLTDRRDYVRPIGPPAYRVRTVKNKEIWENVIDVSTGRTASPELALFLKELEDNISSKPAKRERSQRGHQNYRLDRE